MLHNPQQKQDKNLIIMKARAQRTDEACITRPTVFEKKNGSISAHDKIPP